MAKGKRTSGRLSIFKGREAKLNYAIFHILALKAPLTVYDITREVRKRKFLRRKLYSVINRRVRILQQQDYIEKAGTRKTLAGFTATLYQLTPKAYLAMLLNKTSIEDIIQKADQTTIIELLAALIRE